MIEILLIIILLPIAILAAVLLVPIVIIVLIGAVAFAIGVYTIHTPNAMVVMGVMIAAMLLIGLVNSRYN